jgi:DNA-binding IclR family transcriptional regulator
MHQVVDRRAVYAAPAAACAAEVLTALRRGDGTQSLAELERSMTRSKSLIFRVLRELESHELVVRDASGRYRLGIEAFELGAAYLAHTSYTDLVRQTLAQLAKDTGDTVNLGVLRDADVLYVMKFPGASAYVTISRVGGRVPANCVAIGKALLARLSESGVRARMREPLPKMTERSVEGVDDLVMELERVRQAGYALDREQAALGRCALAVAVEWGSSGEPAAISVSTDASSFDRRLDQLVERLMHAREVLERDWRARMAMAQDGTGGAVLSEEVLTPPLNRR